MSELKDPAEGVGLRAPAARSAILPLMVGDENKAMNLARSFFEAGIFIPAIRYPTVKRGEARLRLTVSALHTAADLAQFCDCLRGLQKQD
jgi:6-carboxyhexanoate--CoA ligase